MTRHGEQPPTIPYQGPDTPGVRERRFWADDMHLWAPGFMFSAAGALIVLGGQAVEFTRRPGVWKMAVLFGSPLLAYGVALLWAWRRRRGRRR